MMHARSVHPHKLRKIETSSDIYGGIHTFSYNISVTSRATRFAVSVPAEEFHFSPTPQFYICKIICIYGMYLLLGRFDTEVYIYIYGSI